MPRGTVFGNERGYMPDAVNVRVRAIRLGQRSMGNPGVLDDLSRFMREADDQREREAARADASDEEVLTEEPA